jgi:hypothetical protein
VRGFELLWKRVELVESVLEVVKFLAGFREFALRGEALVVGEVAAGLGDEGAADGCAPGCVDDCGAGEESDAVRDEDCVPNSDASAASKVGA